MNKNVVNGSEPMLRLIGDLPSGTPVAFEAAFRLGHAQHTFMMCTDESRGNPSSL